MKDTEFDRCSNISLVLSVHDAGQNVCKTTIGTTCFWQGHNDYNDLTAMSLAGSRGKSAARQNSYSCRHQSARRMLKLHKVSMHESCPPLTVNSIICRSWQAYNSRYRSMTHLPPVRSLIQLLRLMLGKAVVLSYTTTVRSVESHESTFWSTARQGLLDPQVTKQCQPCQARYRLYKNRSVKLGVTHILYPCKNNICSVSFLIGALSDFPVSLDFHTRFC